MELCLFLNDMKVVLDLIKPVTETIFPDQAEPRLPDTLPPLDNTKCVINTDSLITADHRHLIPVSSTYH